VKGREVEQSIVKLVQEISKAISDRIDEGLHGDQDDLGLYRVGSIVKAYGLAAGGLGEWEYALGNVRLQDFMDPPYGIALVPLMGFDRKEHVEYIGASWSNIEDVGDGSHALICSDQDFVLLRKFDSPVLFELRQIVRSYWI
jgi:hypothetical protein